MAERLRLLVWTPAETLIESDGVEWVHVKLRGDKGLTIWPGHAPLIAETVAEAVRYADREGTHVVDLPPGIVQVRDGAVTIFLAGVLGEQEWLPEEETERLDRLIAELMSAAGLCKRKGGMANAIAMVSARRDG